MRAARTGRAVAATAAVCLTAWSAPAASQAAGGCPLPTYGPGVEYHPPISPADFSANVDNPYFPLVPGKVLVYTGSKDGKPALDIVAASARTAVIDGVTARVVEDRLYLANRLEERTTDYYAQDRCGNVWYLGEDTATLDRHGHVTSTEGSFHAGVDGAEPGVFMQAHPRVGRRFRQEWYRGQAEDIFWVAALSVPVRVPAGSFPDALRTSEKTALEPGVLDEKHYVRGIGEVDEAAVSGPRETLRLVEVIG